MKPIILVIPLCLFAACSSDSGPEGGQPDATSTNNPDAASLSADAMTLTPDARPGPDANLSANAFVDVDGARLDFDEVSFFDGQANSRTIVASVGANCPFSATCTELYVSFPQDALPGFKICNDSEASVEFVLETNSYFSSAAAVCGFMLEVNDGNTVALTGLDVRVGSVGDSKRLTAGGMRGERL